MILTVTPNPALDVTYTVDALRPDEVHRVGAVAQRGGGKGINVARVLHTVGVHTCAVAPVGGPTGTTLSQDLRAAGLHADLVPVSGETRRTTAVLSASDDSVTLFNEPGAELSRKDWRTLRAAVKRRLPGAAVLVCSGSLPPGAPADGYAQLLALAQGIPTVLDTSGEALLAGLEGLPSVIKPNLDELRAVAGHDDPLTAAQQLCSAGAGAVVVSQGADGLLVQSAAGTWRAVPSARLTGNTTGAGDAAVAGIAWELSLGGGWPEIARRAVALSGAAVLGPLAGDIDLEHFQREHVAVAATEVRSGTPCP
ncbi:1-phosphofructokinase family hexose kinase [Pseudonocardiaceae bacterium YIM PH 21723]|nr:1-phosphofructokinase family hexose kinase [Pseudonocardiaceae bacterium YIM PH 21723]